MNTQTMNTQTNFFENTDAVSKLCILTIEKRLLEETEALKHRLNNEFGDFMAKDMGCSVTDEGNAIAISCFYNIVNSDIDDSLSYNDFIEDVNNYIVYLRFPNDKEAIFKYFTLAAEDGDAEAQYYLAEMYSCGIIPQLTCGMVMNVEAFKWLTLAAEQRDERVFKLYCSAIRSGYDKAKEGIYFDDIKEAAEKGFAEAQNQIAYLLLNGICTAQDTKAAFKYYTLAAEQENAEAQNALGRMYNFGEGTAQNFKAAFKLYILAAEQENSDATDTLSALKLQMKHNALKPKAAAAFKMLNIDKI